VGIISSLARAKGFKADTILEWLGEAAQHAEEAVEEVSERERTGEFWRCTLIESETRLRVAWWAPAVSASRGSFFFL
jgi:hypothetical protein